MLRPDQPDVKRLVFFMIGTAMVLTLFVELFALHGDIGRMNTVFKFIIKPGHSLHSVPLRDHVVIPGCYYFME